MPVTAIVMYPNEEDIKFDEKYYMETHMPLVESVWKKHGLDSWRITKFPTALDGSRSQYLIMATLEWKSQEALQEALKDPECAKVFADIPNFTNTQPVTLGGETLE